MSRSRILLIDDDQLMREFLRETLQRAGYEIREAPDGRAGLRDLYKAAPDLVILDIEMPELDGWQTLERIRDLSDVPVLMLTAREAELERVRGLKGGADDYVVKPFSSAELAARIESVLRRVRSRRPAHMASLVFDELEIDPDAREVRVLGRKIDLTAKEFELLLFLARSPRKVFSRGQLLAQVWDSSSEWQDANTVTEHVRRIRRKIEHRPDQPRWITTVRGAGYRFEA